MNFEGVDIVIWRDRDPRSLLCLDDLILISHSFIMGSLFLRKTPHHIKYHQYNPIIFVTVCTFNRNPHLASHQHHKTLLYLWKNSRHWNVGYYLLMPDHLHLFVKTKGNTNENLSKWISYWKKAFSQAHGYTLESPFWQKNYWDSNVTHPISYAQKWLYVRANPLRKNLVKQSEEWPFQGTIHHLTLDP